MKMFVTQILLALFVFSLSAEAVQPVDGHYEGETSQAQFISFNVINGDINDIVWGMFPTCNNLSWEFLGWEAKFSGENFSWSYNVVQDVDGPLLGIAPVDSLSVFCFGTFDMSTHATGEIWHAVPYRTGNGSATTSCLDKSITFEVNYAGPVTPRKLNSKKTAKSITIFENPTSNL